jgi:hypothetical protein
LLGRRLSVEIFLFRFSALWIFERLVFLLAFFVTFVVFVLLVFVAACLTVRIPFAGESNRGSAA